MYEEYVPESLMKGDEKKQCFYSQKGEQFYPCNYSMHALKGTNKLDNRTKI